VDLIILIACTAMCDITDRRLLSWNVKNEGNAYSQPSLAPMDIILRVVTGQVREFPSRYTFWLWQSAHDKCLNMTITSYIDAVCLHSRVNQLRDKSGLEVLHVEEQWETGGTTQIAGRMSNLQELKEYLCTDTKCFSSCFKVLTNSWLMITTQLEGTIY